MSIGGVKQGPNEGEVVACTYLKENRALRPCEVMCGGCAGTGRWRTGAGTHFLVFALAALLHALPVDGLDPVRKFYEPTVHSSLTHPQEESCEA